MIMDWITITKYVIIVNVLVLCLYTAAARIFGGNEATISYQIQEATHQWPIIAAAIGLLVGHWLWPIK